ncbi:MAG: PilX N-terminal domain-containing pilus assembly protein [Caldimonas sp.]|nr:PilX N-terminal domain-containing pilus assembly protein [Pseudomonadota bacterium]
MSRHLQLEAVLGPRRQRGLSLVTTLLFVLAALVLGVSVLGVGAMQERIIGNSKDRDVALQAAEAALRDAEADISVNVNPSTAFTDDCALGLCTPPTLRTSVSPLPVEKQAGFTWSDSTHVRTYGQYTGASPLPGVASPPVYVIEKLGNLGTPPGESVVIGTEPVAPGVGYRITARATGARPETVASLQSIYAIR